MIGGTTGPYLHLLEVLTEQERRQNERFIGEQGHLRERLSAHRRRVLVQQAIAEKENEYVESPNE